MRPFFYRLPEGVALVEGNDIVVNEDGIYVGIYGELHNDVVPLIIAHELTEKIKTAGFSGGFKSGKFTFTRDNEKIEMELTPLNDALMVSISAPADRIPEILDLTSVIIPGESREKLMGYVSSLPADAEVEIKKKTNSRAIDTLAVRTPVWEVSLTGRTVLTGFNVPPEEVRRLVLSGVLPLPIQSSFEAFLGIVHPNIYGGFGLAFTVNTSDPDEDDSIYNVVEVGLSKGKTCVKVHGKPLWDMGRADGTLVSDVLSSIRIALETVSGDKAITITLDPDAGLTETAGEIIDRYRLSTRTTVSLKKYGSTSVVNIYTEGVRLRLAGGSATLSVKRGGEDTARGVLSFGRSVSTTHKEMLDKLLEAFSVFARAFLVSDETSSVELTVFEDGVASFNIKFGDGRVASGDVRLGEEDLERRLFRAVSGRGYSPLSMGKVVIDKCGKGELFTLYGADYNGVGVIEINRPFAGSVSLRNTAENFGRINYTDGRRGLRTDYPIRAPVRIWFKQ